MDKLNLYIHKKRIKRVGQNFFKSILDRDLCSFDGRPNYLSKENCLSLYNTLGLNPPTIYYIAISNGLDGIDEEGFYNLIEEQNEELKKSIPCRQKDG